MRSVSDVQRVFIGFAILSLLCVGFGVYITQSIDVPLSLSLRNLGAWVIGFGLALLIYKYQQMRFNWIYIIIALIALVCTILGPAQENVQRWIKIGPIVFNAAQLFLPVAIVAFGALNPQKWQNFALAILICLFLLVQPDISQCAAFSLAIGIIAFISRLSKPVKAIVFIALIFFVFITSTALDNLPPIPEVEGIIKLSFEMSPVFGVLCLFLLAITALEPMGFEYKNSDFLPSQIALGAYFIVVSLAPLFGAYPVPLMGIGFSSIIGSWLGIGLLCNIISSAKKIDQGAAKA